MFQLLAVELILAGTPQVPSPEAPDREGKPTAEESARAQDGTAIMPPKIKKRVSPEWPDRARRAGLNGTVILECDLAVDGRISSAKVVKGPRMLGEAAEAAVRKWRYEPAVKGGQPIAVMLTVTVTFRLDKPPSRADLLESVRDEDSEVRWAAVRWLGRYRPVRPEQKRALQVAAGDPDPAVQEAAKQALATLEGK
jgi:TonB family protein